MATVYGIEVAGETYDIEDSNARQGVETNANDIDALETDIENKQDSITESVVYGTSRTETIRGGVFDWYGVTPPTIPAGKKVLRYFAECTNANARAFIGYGSEAAAHAPNALIICITQTASITFRIGAIVF